MNIDGGLEEIDGVIKSETSYAKSETRVEYDEKKVRVKKIIKAIKIAGYEAVVV